MSKIDLKQKIWKKIGLNAATLETRNLILSNNAKYEFNMDLRAKRKLVALFIHSSTKLQRQGTVSDLNGGEDDLIQETY